MPHLFLVPGGRYLVVAAIKRLFVWDLGYVSDARVCIFSIFVDGKFVRLATDRIADCPP